MKNIHTQFRNPHGSTELVENEERNKT